VNSLKTLTLVAVMTAVAYGVWASLHKKPDAEPPASLPADWTAGPPVQMGSPVGGASAALPQGTLPQFVQGGPPGANPLLAPGAGTPATPLAAPVNPPLESQVPSGSPSPTVQPPPGLPTRDGTSATAAGDAAASLSAAGPSPFPSTSAVQATYPNSRYPEAGAANAVKPAEGLAVAGDRPGEPAAIDPAGAGGELAMQFARAFDGAQVQADVGRLGEAHLELSRWYDQQLSPGQQRQMMDMLDRLAGTVIYSHKHHVLERPYEVQPGDTLDRVAQACQVPWQLLGKINGIDDPGALRPGETLKVVRGPFDAVVDVPTYRLTLFLQGRYAGRFNIGIGRDQPLAPGDFEVRAVFDNPLYRGPDIVVNAGDPNNPYGRYFIDLGNQVGIHGTNDPRSIGRNEGRGCISLSADDIEHVHDILSVGSKVIIRR
jgi:lipoprotein-anchoring transpeptidase ErfK/SrfK